MHKFLIAFFLCLFATSLWSQNLAITKKSEFIEVHANKSFVRHISVSLKQSAELQAFPIFYDGELERISNIKIFTKKGKRLKLVKNPTIIDKDVELEIIASKIIKTIILPPDIALVTYTVECNELMYLSNLPLLTYQDTDTLEYKVKVPEQFQLAYDIINTDSLLVKNLDSVKADSHTIWNIKVAPKRANPDPLAVFGIYRNNSIPLIRTLITPSTYSSDAKKYLNDWYLDKLSTRRGLNRSVSTKINELTSGINDPREVMETIYEYVQRNFKYVPLEIGMGAFIPRHSNQVFVNKQGDCKDLSNLLSEALNYKGIKSHVAMAATFQHITDCDFPSLSSANHLVCVAVIDGKEVILDPTDPIHKAGTPVQSLQNRTLLIINESGGEWFKSPLFLPEKNTIDYNIKLSESQGDMSLAGEFEVSYHGISGNFLRRENLDQSDREVKLNGVNHYESVFGNQTVTDLQVNKSDKILSLSGLLSINGKMIKDVNRKFLFLDFAPRLFESIERNILLEGTHFGSNFLKKVNLRIEVDGHYQLASPLEYTYVKDGISLMLKIESPEDKTIQCSYEFYLNHERTHKSNLENINNALEFFKSITHDPVVLEKQT